MTAVTNKWHRRFFSMAYHVATWSKDPSTKVGAVIVDPKTNHILSMGYNGLPRYLEDTEDRLNNREVKYKLVVHAELNAILQAHGKDLRGSTLYTTHPVCGECMKAVIQTGIKEVHTMEPKEKFKERWNEDYATLMSSEAEIEVYYHRNIF